MKDRGKEGGREGEKEGRRGEEYVQTLLHEQEISTQVLEGTTQNSNEMFPSVAAR